MADTKTKILITAEDQASGVFDGLKTKIGGVAAAVAGAFAAGELIDFAQALAPVADAAANLEARLKLAVGANGDLQGALEAVRASANDVGADINSVGELYGRIASSTQDLGFSQERVAALTDTINKSFAVSGTSADAASGAITQLAQAFASGALRGDEFNSVNEAAPRLMDALAKGLGVARGELRAMAEQGQLTTEVVLGALESQREAIERDFATLPDTVGKATQRLANEWQVFIGELDKTTGASEAVAGGLTMVADNLDKIASAAGTAGELVVAALAVKAAAALRGYITLTAASAAATTAQAVAINGLAVAGRAATAAMLTLGRALPALAVAGVIAGIGALVVEFFQAKAAADEFDESLRNGLETPRVNRAAEEIRLVATEAEAARFKLSEVERTFADLRQKGQDAATALGNLVKAADLSSVDGIAAIVSQLEVLRLGAQVTGQEIQTALADRLRKMSAEDLRDFGIQAEMAFNRGALSAQQLAMTLEVQTRAALQKLGVDADVALGGMSAKFIEAAGAADIVASNFDRMKGSGVDAGAALAQALDGAIKVAANPAEIEALRVKLVQMGRDGKLSADQVAAALQKIGDKADQVTPGINSVAEALKKLGITSDAELRKTASGFKDAHEAVVQMGGSLREQRASFQRYAEAAIAANGGVADAALRAKAAQLGLSIEADSTGRVVVRSMQEAAAATQRVGDAAQSSASGYDSMADSAEKAAEAAKKAEDAKSGGSSRAKNLTGSFESPALAILNRAEQLGGLDMRKQIEAEFQRQFSGQMRVASFGLTDYNKFFQGINDKLDDLQVSQEQESGRFEANKPRITGTSERESVTTYRVQIGLGAGRTTTINTASQSDANALTELLRQLEADMSRS